MSDLPVACSLPPETIRTRRAALLPGLLARAEIRTELPEGYRVRFTSEGDTLSTITETVDAERRCCRFLRFQLTVEPDGGPIWLEITGPKGTREFLDALIDG
jgi:hypothetical protein